MHPIDRKPTSTYGSLSTAHDAAGNLQSITIAGGPSYAYAWDEVGRLASASRSDPGGFQIQEQYAYDAGGQRVRVTRQDSSSSNPSSTVQVFDSLVLKGTSFPDANGDYQHDDTTEHLYLAGGGLTVGHVFIPAAGSVPATSTSIWHVFMTLADPLGSTAFVIDHDSGELVEASTYQAYGAVESDYRPARWNSFREDQRYTGQWDNAEVGLVYMSARYYSPQLGRFVSPDPKTIQGGGAENAYAYAMGSPVRFNDPTGLDPTANCDETGCSAWDPEQNVQSPTTGQLQVGTVVNSSPVPTPPPAQITGSLQPTYDQSGNLFAYSPGNDTSLTQTLTPRQIQDQQLGEFTFIASLGLGFIAPAESAVPAQFARGNQFETQGLDIIGGAKNTVSYSGATGAGDFLDTIPDNTQSAMFGNAWNEFKDVGNLSFTRQLQAQQNAALGAQVPWNVIVSPNNQTISQPLWNSVNATGGNIYLLDPTPVTIQGD